MNSLGVITIGQAPRQDMSLAFEPKLHAACIRVIQRGALDALAEGYIRAELAPGPNEAAYITQTSFGSIQLAKKRIIPLLQQCIRELETRCEAIVIVCTGDFPMLSSSSKLWFPDQLLIEAARHCGVQNRLGLVVPLARQSVDIARKWHALDVSVHTAVASPYEHSDLVGAAVQLAQHDPELIVLDCMGYNAAHGETARRASGCEVLVPQEFIPEYIVQRWEAES